MSTKIKSKKPKYKSVFFAIFFLPYVFLIVTYGYVLENISVFNYKFVSLYTSLPILMLPVFFLFLFIFVIFKEKGKLFSKKHSDNINDIFLLSLFLLFFCVFIYFGFSKRLIGLFDTPVLKQGNCRLYRSSGKHGSTEYIELGNITYEIPSHLWYKIKPNNWDCSYSAKGCECNYPVKLLVLPKMRMVLEVIEIK